MSVIRPTFLQVLIADRDRVGGEAANILALIRYVLGVEGAYNGRIEIDGEMWWLTSYADIAESLGGTTPDGIRRVVTRHLEPKGEVLTCLPGRSAGDRTKAYKMRPELPLRDLAGGATSQNTIWPGGLAKQGGGSGQLAAGSGQLAVSIRNEEVVELGEVEEENPPMRIAPSSQFTLDPYRGAARSPTPKPVPLVGDVTSAIGLFDGARVIDDQPASKAVPIVQAVRPLTDDERCKKHETPDPKCPFCKAFARARGGALW
jgi:hypothetical protein